MTSMNKNKLRFIGQGSERMRESDHPAFVLMTVDFLKCGLDHAKTISCNKTFILGTLVRIRSFYAVFRETKQRLFCMLHY